MRRVQIYDTTLRDGSQGEGISFSLHDKLTIARRLDEMGFDYIEGGYPLSNEKDVEFFARLAMQPLTNSTLCAFGMTRRRGVKADDDPGMIALIKSNAPAITMVGKTSAFHVEEVLQVSHEENLAMISDSVTCLVGAGRELIYDAEHFFDGWKLNPEYARQTIEAAAQAGAAMIVLCDTNGGTLPEEIAELTKAAMEAVDIPIGIHCHNDCELGVANSLSSIDAGAVQVQGTINGFGERCGNADLISVVANLAVKKKGYEVLTDSSISRLTELSRFVYETANVLPRNGQAFVGPSAFAHKGGMHVHAVNRVSSSYEHIEPTSVGNERRVLVSELSGRSNIIAKTTKFDLENDKELMTSILEKVVLLENQGYQFEAAEASFDLLVKRCAGTFEPHFYPLKYNVEVVGYKPGYTASDSSEMLTQAVVKLRVGEDERHEVSEADGPVNALDAAIRKALNVDFPELAKMRLLDYKVRVVNSEAGTAARIRVIIESTDGEDTWGSIGVSENIIEASWIALIDAIEYKLEKDAPAKTAKKIEPAKATTT